MYIMAQDTFNSEVVECPDCGGNVSLEGPIESDGAGTAFATISCDSCDFAAREEWFHHRTVRLEP